MIFLILVLGVLVVIALVKASDAQGSMRELTRRIIVLERQIKQSTFAPGEAKASKAPPAERVVSAPAAATPPPAPKPKPPQAVEPIWMRESMEPWATPPPVPANPPPAAATKPRPAPVPVPAPAKPVDWEQFMGAKLFAWVGGLALFLGVAFFVKYSFEHNLIPAELRVSIGFLVGVGLLVGGVIMKRKETAVTAQTLCSTGILILYAVTFACRALYHFASFGQVPTFLLMTLITAVAFLLAVSMDALVVAILGIAGGFLTPVLLSTGQDAPFALFGYIALLDIGLLAVALRQRWNSLPVLGAGGTVLMQLGWIAKFFVAGKYFEDHKVIVAMAVFGGFEALFLAAVAVAKRLKTGSATLSGSALVMGTVALLVSFFFLAFQPLGQQPVLVFSYVFLVDLGLIALVLLDRALATVEAVAGVIVFCLLAAWTQAYFGAPHLHAALAFYLVFALLHLAVPVVMKRLHVQTRHWCLYVTPVLVVPFYFLSFQTMALQPVLLFGTVFIVSVGLLAFALLDREFAPAEGAAGVATFFLLGMWTGNYLSSTHLYAALAFYFIFALFYSAAPVVINRVRGTTLPWWCNSFPALALLLVLMPVFKLPDLSLLIWPLVLLIDVIAVVLAVVTAALLPLLVVLVLTLVATGAWIFRIPSELTGLPTSLFMLGGFAVFFIVAATYVSRKLPKSSPSTTGKTSGLFGDVSDPASLAVQIPALSAVLPFLLLIMLTARLPLGNPSPVFGLALLLVVLLLGLAKIMSIEALPAVGLASVVALEHVWHFHDFNPAHAMLPLAWYVIFYFAFTVFPFLFHKQFAKSAVPWATAALAGPLHFYLLHQLVPAAWPGMRGIMGLLPAAFSIPALLGLIVLLKRTPGDSPARNSQLAWFGAVALFFITLVFPIQFDRQWITIGWACEGAALCWLFHRVPHRGLPVAGVGLLLASFARLALNPAVLSYHSRSPMPVLNWYLYAYGTVAACLFVGAWLLAPPRNRVLENNVPPVLQGLGTVLIFLLVNIEIADYFMAPGTQSLTFEFSGNFARDMSYSMAWAMFALLMLVVGIAKRLAPVRYASIGLLATTLIKLFLHDLSQLDQLYRIAAFIVVAVIAIFASFLYQRFLGAVKKSDETIPTPPPIQ